MHQTLAFAGQQLYAACMNNVALKPMKIIGHGTSSGLAEAGASMIDYDGYGGRDKDGALDGTPG